jgi:hypothetical protein
VLDSFSNPEASTAEPLKRSHGTASEWPQWPTNSGVPADADLATGTRSARIRQPQTMPKRHHNEPMTTYPGYLTEPEAKAWWNEQVNDLRERCARCRLRSHGFRRSIGRRWSG